MVIKKELRALSETELLARQKELRAELFKLNAQRASGANPENPGLVRKTRKMIAKIATLLRERELETLRASSVAVKVQSKPSTK